MSTLYLDTNIYNFIAEKGEALVLRRALKKAGWRVVASSTNLTEVYANPDPGGRSAALGALVKAASIFEKAPVSWLQAHEVLAEVRRCHPDWLKIPIHAKKARDLLRLHTKAWEGAKLESQPDDSALAAYRKVFEAGASASRQSQKTLRESFLARPGHTYLVSIGASADASGLLDIENPEVYWRVDSLSAWYKAMIEKRPESRDYADWLSPYLVDGAFASQQYDRFWLEEVDGANMPNNRLCGLVAYCQSQHKITHGNAEDQFHACHLLQVDLFLTCDRALSETLASVCTHDSGIRGMPMLLNRAAASAVEEILSATTRFAAHLNSSTPVLGKGRT